MQYTNSQILASVLNYFAQPIIKDFVGQKIVQTGGYQMVENTIKKWLPVSPNYSLMNDISFAIHGASDKAIVPILNKYLSSIPDDIIPSMAHSIVDSALASGKYEFVDGKLEFTREDILNLKALLDDNLPLRNEDNYVVKTRRNEAKVQAAESPEQNRK